ncbi:TerB family tellurite resistance protein [filamentous cyanobacterium LEGE 11480]|uniref:TerB family tellurite resistance protein n=1 Tax=Romeriopsis navalis LEGE 11480 TaxID=2777977 RepID=A0A928VRG1_9CYAN|nr:TerB family tellurite resistance protein [Romeriopsis navalis LEGE 11480]
MNPTNFPPNAGPNPRCSERQIQLWLRGLLTLAWADGDFDETEQQLVASLTQHEVTSEERAHQFDAVTAADLTAAFGQDPELAEDFLRTAVMVAIADGVYTTAEDALLTEFCQALGTGIDVLESLRLTLVDRDSGDVQVSESMVSQGSLQSSSLKPKAPPIDPLQPVRSWLDGMQVQDPKIARFLCRLIPSQCPFERDVVLFGKKVVHIPPMCKVNPLYEQLVGLRFRSLSYLADDCGEDITAYL